VARCCGICEHLVWAADVASSLETQSFWICHAKTLALYKNLVTQAMGSHARLKQRLTVHTSSTVNLLNFESNRRHSAFLCKQCARLWTALVWQMQIVKPRLCSEYKLHWLKPRNLVIFRQDILDYFKLVVQSFHVE
jgi:hypothetical protein